MSYQQAITQAKINMDDSIEYLQDELRKFKTGRAQTSLVEDIMIECYGTKTPLKQLATLGAPEPTMITIQPFDRNSIKDIEKGISESDLNLSTSNDGALIRIQIPPLTEERRQELVQVLNQKIEEVKVAIRNYREEAMKQIKQLESDKQISEDDKFKAKEDLDKIVSEYNSKTDEIKETKEKEIMTI